MSVDYWNVVIYVVLLVMKTSILHVKGEANGRHYGAKVAVVIANHETLGAVLEKGKYCGFMGLLGSIRHH